MSEIDEIRARHLSGERPNAVADRAWLLVENEQLREENRILRATLRRDFSAAIHRFSAALRQLDE